MLQLITTELFVPKGAITSRRAHILLDGLFAGGLSFEQEPGHGGRYWAYPRWYESRPLEEAVRWVDYTWNWSIELWLTRPDGSRTTLSLTVDRERRLAPFESVGWSGDWRQIPGDRALFAQQFLTCSLVLANLVRPVYGWGGSNAGLRGSGATPVRGRGLIELVPQEIEWLNVFGSAYVERIGLERLLSATVWRRDVLLGGGVALTLAPDHELVDLAEAARLARHLGMTAPAVVGPSG